MTGHSIPLAKDYVGIGGGVVYVWYARIFEKQAGAAATTVSLMAPS